MADKYRKKWIEFVVICFILLSYTTADFTTECQRPCDCRWQSGNKAAICSNSTFKSVPANLSNDIQILDLSNNNLRQLHQEAFKKVGLSNLKKLFLRECNIESIHKTAFLSLAIVIELDLSKNRISSLHADTFKGTEKLRLINLSNNLIEKLEDGLFRNLKYLQKVEVSNNRIVRVATRTFVNLPQLKILRFDGNNISHMKPETLMSLGNLSGLDLHNNPWRCDCNLQNFRNWVITHNLYTPPTSCAAPLAIKDKLWNELDSTNFACRPTILEPSPDTTVKSYDDNVTLTCKVVGNPTPDVVWKFNSRIIEGRTYAEMRYVMMENTQDLIRWTNLTIINARYSDRGNYTCIAENPGGRDEKTLLLVLTKYGDTGTFIGLESDSFAILVGCLTAVIIVCCSFLLLCYYLSRKSNAKRLIKPDTNSSNGEALIEGSIGAELDKGCTIEVNPVTKPPRKYDALPSLANEVTEMSELNRKLIENDSSLAYNEDHNHLEEMQIYPKPTQQTQVLNYCRQEQQTYPPDLLSFPLRIPQQISPASNGIISSHGLAHGEGSIKSPTYKLEIDNLRLEERYKYKASVPSTNSKDGFSTLAREVKTSSWQPDEMRNHQDFTQLNGTGLYCDNFGMKLFGNGSVYYSLNKSEIDLGPYSAKPERSLHVEYNNMDNCTDDTELAPSPAPGTPHATIPKNSLSSPNINQLLALQAMSLNSISSNAGRYSSKLGLSSDPRILKDLHIPSQNDTLLKFGNSVNIISATLGRTRSSLKPPPKSRSRNTNDPFLVHSGDTATQV